jgi:8-hydroxy-5-deazaflavin:NADPH oxidoreductase
MKAIIGILGGTGHEGKGLGLRWAHAGYQVVIGSRDPGRARATAAAIAARAVAASVSGTTNFAAAECATICVLTVPYAAHRTTLESVQSALSGKILIDVTVPLLPPKVTRVQLPPEGSAAVAAQTMLGPDVKVVSAFQNVSAHFLETLERFVDCDVLVCSDDKDARECVIALAAAAGMRGIPGGVLANSAAAEALTSVLIFLNGRYKIKSSGIRFTGIPDDAAATRAP